MATKNRIPLRLDNLLHGSCSRKLIYHSLVSIISLVIFKFTRFFQSDDSDYSLFPKKVCSRVKLPYRLFHIYILLALHRRRRI